MPTKTEQEKQTEAMQKAHKKWMRDLSMTWAEGRNARKPGRPIDTNDIETFDGDSLADEARRLPGQDGRCFDSCNGGKKFEADNPEPDLLDIVEVFASKFR